jgi:hypothetical protein
MPRGYLPELQAAGVEPDLWKIEGLDRREDCQTVVATARAGGRDAIGCIILGRGENDQKVREWLNVAATVPGFIGFAVGRTDFWEPLVKLARREGDARRGRRGNCPTLPRVRRHLREDQGFDRCPGLRLTERGSDGRPAGSSDRGRREG